MEFVLILKYLGMAISLLDILAGALPDKYLKWHSIILQTAKKTHEFGLEEAKGESK